MCETRVFIVMTAVAILCAPWAAPAGAEPRTGLQRPFRIRTTDADLKRLLDAGTRASITLRMLVDRIEASDVVVFLQCSPVANAAGVDGRLLFAGAGGGLRYVVVRLARRGSAPRRIAMLAHELQHAVEVADRPAIVDSRSMAREYRRMGAVTRAALPGQLAFDTHEAMEITARVMRELRAAGW